MILSLAATALAQGSGDENGTSQTGTSSEGGELTSDTEAAREISKADGNGPENEDRDLFFYLQVFGVLLGIIVSFIIIYKFVWHREYKTKPALSDSNPVDNVKSTYPPGDPGRPLGKINNFPHPHNPNFTGRVDLLDRLHEALASGERAAFTQTSAITGLGGVGKTQLALQYAYTHLNDYQVIWWVRSEEPATLAADYATLASRLDLPEKDARDQRVTVEAVRCWLEQNGGWLLVFDNAQEPEDLGEYLPTIGKGHVIITSRNQNWGGTAKPLPVDVFSRDESIDFLQSRTRLKDGADSLAEALGDLPLALEQAGAYIQETGISLSPYLKLFQERQKELLGRGKPDAYPDTVATTWALSFQKASEEVPASADLLNLCAFLAPDDIPKSLLTDGVEHLPEPLASAVADEMELNDAVAALKRYSLMTVTDDSLSIHRLVQAVARDRLSEKEQKRWAEAAVRLVFNVFPFQTDDVRNWDECSVLFPHALVVAAHAEGLDVVPKLTQSLLVKTGLYFKGRAKIDEARNLFERALPIAENVFGRDNVEVAAIIHNLGGVLKDMGELAGAKELYERALKIVEEDLGADDPKVAVVANGLGIVLKDMGDLGGAKELIERAIKIDENVLGPDSFSTARYVNNLGTVLQDMGDLEGAKELIERAINIFEKTRGPNDPWLATAVNNLGAVLRDLGDLEGAEKCVECALQIFEKRLGEDHPKTKTVRENLELLRR